MLRRLPALSSILVINALSTWTLHVSLLLTKQLAVSANCQAFWLELASSNNPSNKPPGCPFVLKQGPGYDNRRKVPGLQIPTTGGKYTTCYYVAEDTACSTKPDDLFSAKDPDPSKHGKAPRLGIYCGMTADLNKDRYAPDNVRPGWRVSWDTKGKRCDVIPTYEAPINAVWLVIKNEIKSKAAYDRTEDCPYQLEYQFGTRPGSGSNRLSPLDTTRTWTCFYIYQDFRCDGQWFTVTTSGLKYLGVYCGEGTPGPRNPFFPANAFGRAAGYIHWYFDEGQYAWRRYSK